MRWRTRIPASARISIRALCSLGLGVGLTFAIALALPGAPMGLPARAAERTVTEGEILRKTAEIYRGIPGYLLKGVSTTVARQGERSQTEENTFLFAAARPGKLREEIENPKSHTLKVSDGRATWTYLGTFNQFTVEPGAAPDFTDSVAATRPGTSAALVATLAAIDLQVDSARVLRRETLRFQGEERPCHVIQVHYSAPEGAVAPKGPQVFWVDQERSLVLQVLTTLVPPGGQGTSYESTLRFGQVSLREPPPDSLFVFQVPEGAKQVRRFRPPQLESELVGKLATNFSLADLGGKRHKLSTQKGKVVMLDFWATWCGPCRIQMPAVDRLYQEFKSKGLVVYAVNQGESAAKADAYMKKHGYKTTTLLDPDGKIGKAYGVAGIPTLVIVNREGKIATHFMGVRDEAELREALEQTGIK